MATGMISFRPMITTITYQWEHMKNLTVDDFKEGEIIEWKEHKGYINFISEEYLTLCIKTYDKPEEIA